MTPSGSSLDPAGDYVFTLVTDALRIRTRSDSGSTVSPRRLQSRAFPSMALRHSHATGRLRPEGGRESENHQRAHLAKHRRFPVAHRDNTAAEQAEASQPRRGWSNQCQRGGLNHRGFDAHRARGSTCGVGTQPIVYSSLMTKILGK
jgi:hypothetical protein